MATTTGGFSSEGLALEAKTLELGITVAKRGD
jgi:hypothetical protein